MIKVIVIELIWVSKRKGLAKEIVKIFYNHEKAKEWVDKRSKNRKHIKFVSFYLNGREVSQI